MGTKLGHGGQRMDNKADLRPSNQQTDLYYTIRSSEVKITLTKKMLFYKFQIFLQILAYQSFAQARNVNEGLKAKGAISNSLKSGAKWCIFSWTEPAL